MEKTMAERPIRYAGLAVLIVLAVLMVPPAEAARLEPAKANVAVSSEGIACDEAVSTFEINECALQELGLAEAALLSQLDKVYSLYANDEELLTSIRLAQQRWQAYMSAHCESIHLKWRGGTIRGLMGLSCKTSLTQQRSRELWLNFVNTLDNAGAVQPLERR